MQRDGSGQRGRQLRDVESNGIFVAAPVAPALKGNKNHLGMAESYVTHFFNRYSLLRSLLISPMLRRFDIQTDYTIASLQEATRLMNADVETSDQEDTSINGDGDDERAGLLSGAEDGEGYGTVNGDFGSSSDGANHSDGDIGPADAGMLAPPALVLRSKKLSDRAHRKRSRKERAFIEELMQAAIDHHGSVEALLPTRASTKLEKARMWLRGGGIPISLHEKVRKTIIRDGVVRGVNVFMEKIWPIVFYSVFTHDLIVYSKDHNLRYGNTLGKIFIGQSENEVNLTTFLAEQWWWALTLVMGPIVFGIYSALMRRNWHCDQHESDVEFHNDLSGLASAVSSYDSNNWLDIAHWMASSVPFAPRPKIVNALRKAEANLLWNRCMMQMHSAAQDISGFDRGRKNLLSAVISKAKSGPIMTQLQAVSVLANVLNGISQKDLKHFDEDSRGKLLDLQDDAKNTLIFLTKYSIDGSQQRSLRPLIRYIYAHYQIWAAGYPKSKVLRVPFWIFYAIKLFARLWYGLSIGLFTYSQVNWWMDKISCESVPNKSWVLLLAAAAFGCSDCGNWDDMNYNNIFSPQTCVDDYFSRSRSGKEARIAVNRFRYQGFKKISFENQHWTSWDDDDFEKVLQYFAEAAKSSVEVLSLGSAGQVGKAKAQLIACYLPSLNPKKIDLSNSQYEGEGLRQILLNLPGDTSELNLAGTATNENVQDLAEVLPRLTQLEHLNLLKTGLSDADMKVLSPALENSPVKALILAENNFQQVGLDAFAERYPALLDTLVLDDNNLAGVDFNPLAMAIGAANLLTTFSAAGIGMTDVMFPSLAPAINGTNVTHIDVSRNILSVVTGRMTAEMCRANQWQSFVANSNQLGNEGVAYVVTGCVNSTLTNLGVDANGIEDSGWAVVANNIEHTSLERLSARYNSISAVSMSPFSRNAPNSNLREFYGDHNPLHDNGALYAAEMISHPNSSITVVSVANTGFSTRGGEAICHSLQGNQRVTHIDLSGNDLFAAGDCIIRSLESNVVEVIDLSNAGLLPSHGNTFADIMSESHVKTAILDGNNMRGKGVAIAKAWVEEVPNIDTIGTKTAARDFRRALHDADRAAPLEAISLNRAGLDTNDARALCLASQVPSVKSNGVSFKDNKDVNYDLVEENCAISPARRSVQPPAIYSWMAYAIRSLSIDNARLLLAHVQEQISGETCQHEQQEVAGFMQVLLQTASGSSALPFVADEILPYVIAFVLVFRNEAASQLVTLLPEKVSAKLFKFAQTDEARLLDAMTEYAARNKFAGLKVMAHDITKACKEAAEENQEKGTVVIVTKVAEGVAGVGVAYGAAKLFSSYVSQTASALTLPLLLNARNITSKTREGYQRNGLFGALDEFTESMARAVPGGSIIMDSLNKQERALEIHFKNRR